MKHFIELTQRISYPFTLEEMQEEERVVSVNVEHIDFFYNNRVVLANRAIEVYDSYDEIKMKIDKAVNKE